MPATWTQTWDQVKEAVKLLEDQRASFVSGAATGYLTQEAVVNAALNLEGPNAALVSGAMVGLRGTLDGWLRQGRGLLDPYLFELGRIAKAPERDPDSILRRLTRYMIDDPDGLGNPRIASRQFTRGAFASGTPFVGNGTVHRITVDEDNVPLEASFSDVVTLACLQDRQSGADPGRELFEVRGRYRPDTITYYTSSFGLVGSGARELVAAVSADDSQALLGNPSFSDFSGAVAAPTAITNWEFLSGVTWSETAANVQVDQTNRYRDALLEGTSPASLRFDATQEIRQRFSKRRTVLVREAPYYLQIAWNREIGAASGTLTLKLGSQTVSVTVAAQTGWQLLRIPVDFNSYLRRFDVDDASINVQWTRTGGTLLVDDVVFAPFRAFDGAFLQIVGGATPFLLRDTGTFTDTEVGAKIQRWLHRLYAYALPSATGGAITIADPA